MEKAKMEINVIPEGMKEASLEEIAIFAQWLSREWPEVFFGEIGEKKIVFVPGWKVNSKILEDGTHLICRTAIDVIFTKVDEYKRFLVYDEGKGKAYYINNPRDAPPTAKVIPVRISFTLSEEKVLEVIKNIL
jgi:hypothetical protein